MRFFYGLSSLLSTVFGYLALSCGPMAVTSVICSYSIVIPCIFGIAVWGESVSFFRIIGFVILAFSLYLLGYKDSGKALSKKWAFYLGVTFICNGVGSVVQKLHQRQYPGEYCREFTFFSFAVIFASLLAVILLKREKSSVRAVKYALPAGIFMGMANFMSLYLSATVDATVLFPLMTVFKVLFNCLISRVLFRNKMTVKQLAGIAVGALSVIMIK